MFEVDLDQFRTLCEDAGLHPVIVPGPDRHHIGIAAADARDLLTFVLTVAPDLDDHFETVDGELDFRPVWLNVVEHLTPSGQARYEWPDVRPVRAIAETR